MTVKTDLERARGWAVALENENRRLEDRVRTLTEGAADREAILTEARDALEAANAGGHGDDWPHLAPGIRALYARAERAEQQLAHVRAYADKLCAEPHPTHDHVCPDEVRKGLRAALDSGEQPSPDADRLILDGRALPVLSHWREQGPTSDGREKWVVVTQQPGPAAEESPS